MNSYTEPKNKDIRAEAKANGVQLWRIAEALRVSDPTLSRLFRHELPAEKKEEIRAIIKELSAEAK